MHASDTHTNTANKHILERHLSTVALHIAMRHFKQHIRHKTNTSRAI